jgi:hypothetical protein
MEVVGLPRLEWCDGEPVVSVRAKLNVNLKSERIEDVIGRRQKLHLASLENLKGELFRDLDNSCPLQIHSKDAFAEADEDVTLPLVIQKIKHQFLEVIQKHSNYKAEEFNNEELYKTLIVEAIDSKAHAQSKLDLFNTLSVRISALTIAHQPDRSKTYT